MNAERLHAIVIALNKEVTGRGVVNKMQEMVNALQNVVNQPHPSHQQNLATSRDAMYAAVTDTASDEFSPTWRQILSEIGGDDLFGKNLKEDIEAVFARNQLTPAVALEDLRKLLDRLQKFTTALDEVASSFRLFEIGHEQLAPGECEIGVLIPRPAVSNRLLDFAKELNELGFILNTFSEVATGKKDELTIRTISSSDLLVYLQAAAPYAACLGVAIERVAATYKQLLEIRKLRQEIRKQGVPEDRTAGIEKYANELMERGIEETSLAIVDGFYKEKEKDKGRKNELTNAVRISLKEIASRIDRGFNLEVRVEPLAAKDQTAENEQLQKAIASFSPQPRICNF